MSNDKTVVKSGADAIDIARKTAEKAGFFPFFSVTEAKKEETKWIVDIRYFQNKYRCVIDAVSGDVVSWKEELITS